MTRYHKTIPLEGKDNLIDALAQLIELRFKQKREQHLQASPTFWIDVHNQGPIWQRMKTIILTLILGTEYGSRYLEFPWVFGDHHFGATCIAYLMKIDSSNNLYISENLHLFLTIDMHTDILMTPLWFMLYALYQP